MNVCSFTFYIQEKFFSVELVQKSTNFINSSFLLQCFSRDKTDHVTTDGGGG